MNGLKLMAAGICGSAFSLGLTTWAQAPKRAVSGPVECIDSQEFFHIEHDLDQMSDKLEHVAADQKSTLQWAQWVSGDLAELKMRR